MTTEEAITIKKQIRKLKCVAGECFAHAQKLTVHSDLPLLYHEGVFGDLGMHAWCSYNNEIIDPSSAWKRGGIIPDKDAAAVLYTAMNTYTKTQVCEAVLKTMNWYWIGDRDTYHE